MIIMTNSDILQEDGSSIPPYFVVDDSGNTIFVAVTKEECDEFIEQYK